MLRVARASHASVAGRARVMVLVRARSPSTSTSVCSAMPGASICSSSFERAAKLGMGRLGAR